MLICPDLIWSYKSCKFPSFWQFPSFWSNYIRIFISFIFLSLGLYLGLYHVSLVFMFLCFSLLWMIQGIPISKSLVKEECQCYVLVEFRIYIFFRGRSLFLICFPIFSEIVIYSPGRNIDCCALGCLKLQKNSQHN